MRPYLIVSLLLAAGACAAFFFSFEKRKPDVKDIVPVAVMCAAASAGRVLFHFIPQIQPVTAVVIIMGLCYGGRTGFLTGALSALVSNLFLGQGPWTPFQMLAWGTVGLVAGWLSRFPVMKKTWAVCLYGVFAAFLYGAVTDIWTIAAMGESLSWGLVLAVYGMAFVFNLLHAAGNAAFLLLLYGPFTKKLSRIKQKFGVLSEKNI